jgi:hypothetical protein
MSNVHDVVCDANHCFSVLRVWVCVPVNARLSMMVVRQFQGGAEGEASLCDEQCSGGIWTSVDCSYVGGCAAMRVC